MPRRHRGLADPKVGDHVDGPPPGAPHAAEHARRPSAAGVAGRGGRRHRHPGDRPWAVLARSGADLADIDADRIHEVARPAIERDDLVPCRRHVAKYRARGEHPELELSLVGHDVETTNNVLPREVDGPAIDRLDELAVREDDRLRHAAEAAMLRKVDDLAADEGHLDRIDGVAAGDHELADAEALRRRRVRERGATGAAGRAHREQRGVRGLRRPCSQQTAGADQRGTRSEY